MRRFAIAADRIDGERVTFDRGQTRHLARVLRLRPGDLVIATDGLGHEYTVRIEALGTAAAGTILDVARGATESPLAITLIQGIPKSDKMEAIVRAATELGVARVIPAIAARTVVALDGARWAERSRRWQRVASEAAKQCRRAVVPEVLSPVPLSQALEGAAQTALRICLWEGERRGLGEVLDEAGASLASADVVIGPEGGLSPAEVERARTWGWAVAGLGPRILRTETAGPAVLALLQARFGDLIRVS